MMMSEKLSWKSSASIVFNGMDIEGGRQKMDSRSGFSTGDQVG